MSEPLPFIDLEAQRTALGSSVEDAIGRVLDHGRFINGPEVEAFEDALGSFCGAPHVVGCASGTDALLLALLALGVGAGDAVIVPSFTFASTAETVALLGATPAFVDVCQDTFNIDPGAIGTVAASLRGRGLRPVGVIAVDLFGLPADYDAIDRAAGAADLWVIADAAQSMGGYRSGRAVGMLAPITATSFFPAKPLGCYGDGGAVLVHEADLAEILRSLRVHGQGRDKYDNVRIGINGRLDTIQAAVLMEKLRIFPGELDARQSAADRYAALLDGVVATPVVPPGVRSAWAQYTVRVPHDRDGVAARMKGEGVPTAVYYPRPLHQQSAYRHFPVAEGGLPVCERLADEVLSLPMHPYLSEGDQARVVEALSRAIA